VLHALAAIVKGSRTEMIPGTTHPMFVGGQMLNLLHPAHLHISAEYAEPESLQVGRAVPGALKEAYLLGHDERDLPTVQDQRIDTEYNGWWACLIPAAVVRAIGYPLPLFFQWDDIEYGYRARAHGIPTVALPGAGVAWLDAPSPDEQRDVAGALGLDEAGTGLAAKFLIAAMLVALLELAMARWFSHARLGAEGGGAT